MNSEQNSSQIKAWYEAQKDGKWKNLTDSLSQNSLLHAQLNFIALLIKSWHFLQKQPPVS